MTSPLAYQDWWSASEIAEARLPDLPTDESAVKRLAKRQHWRAKGELARRRRGQRGGGWEYHVTLFPARARARIIARAASQPGTDTLSGGAERTADWAAYETLPLAVKARAERRVRAVRAFRDLHRAGATRDAASRYVASEQGVSLPDLAIETEDHRGAGMDAPVAIDMGMGPLEAELTFAAPLPAIFQTLGNRLLATLRAATVGESDFEADGWAFVIGGRVIGAPIDAVKLKSDVMLKQRWRLDYYRVERDREVLIEIDVESGRRVVGGVDQTASIRAAIGI